MPDTGAPWNIPYVAGTDLVADWPTDNQTQAEALADLFTAVNVGIGGNIVQTIKTDTFSTSNTSPTDVTGLSLTITPSSATSKVLVMAFVASSSNVSGSAVHMQLVRDSTAVLLGDASGSTSQSTFTNRQGNAPDIPSTCIVYLDSPATTSPTTYKMQLWSGLAGTVYLNRAANETNNAGYGRVASTITAIEVYA